MRHYAFMRQKNRGEAGTGITSSFWGYYAPFNHYACMRTRVQACVMVTQACRQLVATLHHEPEHCKTVNQCLHLQAVDYSSA